MYSLVHVFVGLQDKMMDKCRYGGLMMWLLLYVVGMVAQVMRQRDGTDTKITRCQI